MLTSDGCHTAAGLIETLLCLDLTMHAMLAHKQRCGVHSPCTSALQPLLGLTKSHHQYVCAGQLNLRSYYAPGMMTVFGD